MQVGTTSSNIGLTEDAMDVIVELVKLDGEQLKEKAIFFEQLYKLWMSDDLVTSDNISRTFDANKKVIKETILKTLDPKEQEYHKTVELAHKTLLGGMPFTNPATQIVHASCEIEIKRFERLRKKNRNTLDYRFTKLYDELRAYIDSKNDPQDDRLAFVPLKAVEATRPILPRNAKENSKGKNKGLQSREKRKRSSKKSDGDDSDELSEVIKVLFIIGIILTILLCITFILGFQCGLRR